MISFRVISTEFTSALCLLVIFLFTGNLTNGAEILDVEIDRDGRRYTLVSTTHFNASPNQVFSVLIDYDRLAEISKSIKESRYLDPTDDGKTLVFTRIGACVFFYCKNIEKIEYLEYSRPSYIETTAIPERSDVRYSRSEWTLAADERGGTQVVYRLELEPGFWVPPVIGPMVIRRALIADGADAVQKIEAMAKDLSNSSVTEGT